MKEVFDDEGIAVGRLDDAEDGIEEVDDEEEDEEQGIDLVPP